MQADSYVAIPTWLASYILVAIIGIITRCCFFVIVTASRSCDGRNDESSCSHDSSNNDNSDDNDGVVAALTALLGIAVIGLIISAMINAFLAVKLKQSRCVFSVHVMYL